MSNSEKLYVSVQFLMKRYEISRETLYKYMKEYGFPRQYKLTPGSARWLLSEVEQWESTRMQKNVAA